MLEDAVSADTPRTVAVVGAGLFGTSWAALFSSVEGKEVAVWDPDPTVKAKVQVHVAEASCQLAVLGLVQPECVRVVETLEEAIEGADFFQENAPKALALKRDLDRRLEQIARPDVVLASSTSAFCWSELTDGMSTRSRLVTTHPFNPPHLIHIANRLSSALWREAVSLVADGVTSPADVDAA